MGVSLGLQKSDLFSRPIGQREAEVDASLSGSPSITDDDAERIWDTKTVRIGMVVEGPILSSEVELEISICHVKTPSEPSEEGTKEGRCVYPSWQGRSDQVGREGATKLAGRLPD